MCSDTVVSKGQLRNFLLFFVVLKEQAVKGILPNGTQVATYLYLQMIKEPSKEAEPKRDVQSLQNDLDRIRGVD